MTVGKTYLPAQQSGPMAKRARRGTRGGRPAKAPKRGRETHAQRLARTRKAIERFERHLVRGGEGPVRVTRHVDRMLSFGVEHLVEQMGTTPMDVDADKVGLYMGVWFPYQFQREPVKEVGVMLDTLERWFRFLHRDGLYRQGDLRAVLEVLGRKRLYEERFDSYLVLLNAGPPTEGPLTE